MVNILPAPRTFGSEFGRAFGGGLGQGFSEGMKLRGEKQALASSSKALKDAGIEVPEGLKGDERKLFITEKMKGLRESEKFANQLKANEDIIRQIEIDRGEEPGSLQAYVSNPAMAERITKPKAEAGGVGAQEVPPKVAKSIRDVLESHPDANADELGLAMGEAKVPTFWSNSYVENRRRQDESKSAEEREARKLGQERAYNTIKEADELALALPQQQQAVNLMNHALSTGDLSFFTTNNLADWTGLDFLRDPAGALFKTGGKEFLLGDLSRIKGRPNQYIEQQVMDSLGKIGQSQAANMIVTRAKQNELDLKQERINVTNKIANEWQKKTGRLPWNMSQLVNEELNTYAIAKEKEMFNEFKAINAIQEGKKEKMEPVEPGTIPSKLILQAIRNKYPNDKDAARKELQELGYQL